MIRVPVAELQDGQILAQDVTHQDGMVILTRGKEITPEVKSLLERMEVAAVVVEGDAFASEDERQAYLAQSEVELYRRFSRVEDDPLLMGLRELFLRRLHQGVYVPPAPKPPPPPPPPGPKVIYSKKDRKKP